MAEFPALPLWTDAFIGDTTHLNANQTGAYLMLLMCAWRTPDCRIPDDDKLLARMARMDNRAWASNKAIVMSFWKQDDDGKWYQRRLLDERNFVAAKRNQNKQAGIASALKRKGRHSTDVINPLQRETNQPTPTPTPTPFKTEKTPIIPLGDDFDIFWKEYPHKVGKAAAVTAWKRAVKKTSSDKLIDATKNHAKKWQKDRTELQFIPHPSTWLNQDRWLDDLKPQIPEFNGSNDFGTGHAATGFQC